MYRVFTQQNTWASFLQFTELCQKAPRTRVNPGPRYNHSSEPKQVDPSLLPTFLPTGSQHHSRAPVLACLLLLQQAGLFRCSSPAAASPTALPVAGPCSIEDEKVKACFSPSLGLRVGMWRDPGQQNCRKAFRKGFP